MNRAIHLADATVLIGHLPSLKSKCPRKDCRAEMSVRPVEHMLVYECPACFYEARETSAGMRADWELGK